MIYLRKEKSIIINSFKILEILFGNIYFLEMLEMIILIEMR